MKLFLILLILLLPCVVFAQPFLACDLPEAGVIITQTIIEITTNPGPSQAIQEVSGIAIIQGTDFKLYDLSSLPAGKYSFRAKWTQADGFWGEYSLPFVLTRPARPSGFRLIP